MIVWQRRANAAWIGKNEERLRQLVGSNLAIILQPGRSRGLLEVACDRPNLTRQLLREFGGSSRRLPDDWWRSFSSAHPPIRIGRRLEIVSRAPNRLPARATLIIPAASAFGTGEHATTAMSLRLLEEATRNFCPGWRLLDAGTGTGILALGARKLGAGSVLGIDNDPGAVINARRNARLNRIARARFIVADVLRFKSPDSYEVVTANLFSELLIAALPVLGRGLKAGGRIILSGILRQQVESVLIALERDGFELEKKRRRGKWVALQARRKRRLAKWRPLAV
jgi:ribosomal protein L11 methyltransferase